MIGFVLKGLLRDRSRSLFPVLMVTAGVFLTVVLYGFMQGVLGDLVSSTAKYDTGHVKITTRAWRELADQTPNDLALMNADNVIAQLRQDEGDMLWTGRIRFGGLLDAPDAEGETRAQGPVAGLALDLLGSDSPEKSIFPLEDALVRGRLPEEQGEILISEAFAKGLGAAPGDRVTLIGSTMYGAMAIANFTVAGTLSFGVVALDRGMLLVDLRDAQAATSTWRTRSARSSAFPGTWSIQKKRWPPLQPISTGNFRVATTNSPPSWSPSGSRTDWTNISSTPIPWG
ncbi:hypothetical protein MASR2M79_02180 [Aminivibrio sp.]